MQQCTQFLRAFPVLARIHVEFCQCIHPRKMQGSRPAAPVLCSVVDVPPTALLPVEAVQEVLHLVVRKMHGHIELEEEHIIRPPVVGIFYKPSRHRLIGGIGDYGCLDKGLPDFFQRCTGSRSRFCLERERQRQAQDKGQKEIFHHSRFFSLSKIQKGVPERKARHPHWKKITL